MFHKKLADEQWQNPYFPVYTAWPFKIILFLNQDEVLPYFLEMLTNFLFTSSSEQVVGGVFKKEGLSMTIL